MALSTSAQSIKSRRARASRAVVGQASTKCPELQLDEDSTDVGSSVSDAETTCSSIVSSARGTEVDDQPVTKNRCGGGPRSAKQHQRPPRKRFNSTFLEPIPGSPAKRSDCEVLLLGPSLMAEQEKANPKGQFCPPPGLSPMPQSTHGAAHLLSAPLVLAYEPPTHDSGASGPLHKPPPYDADVHMDLMQVLKIPEPLKVRPSEEIAVLARPLDPTQPVKKRPAFPEFAGITNFGLQPGVPVKKKLSYFLLEEPRPLISLGLAPR